MQLFILATALIFILPFAQSMSLHDALFPNDIGFHSFKNSLWATLGGTDQQNLSMTSASAAFEKAQNLSILPPNTNIDVSKLDTNKDGVLNRNELFSFINVTMKALNVRDVNTTFSESIDESNLKAVHENLQQSICNTVDPSTNLTVKEVRHCLSTQTCLKNMPCLVQGVAIYRRGFISDVTSILYYSSILVISFFIVRLMISIMGVATFSVLFILAAVILSLTGNLFQ